MASIPPPSRRCAKVLVFQERWEYGQLVGYDCTNEPGLPVSEEELQRRRDPLINVDSDLLRCLTEVLNKGRYDNWKVHSIVEKRPVGGYAVEEGEETHQSRMGTPSPRLPRRHSELLYEGPSTYSERYYYPDRSSRRYSSRELASPFMNTEYPSTPRCQYNILIEGEDKDDRSLIHPQQSYYYPPNQHSAPGAPPPR